MKYYDLEFLKKSDILFLADHLDECRRILAELNEIYNKKDRENTVRSYLPFLSFGIFKKPDYVIEDDIQQILFDDIFKHKEYLVSIEHAYKNKREDILSQHIKKAS